MWFYYRSYSLRARSLGGVSWRRGGWGRGGREKALTYGRHFSSGGSSNSTDREREKMI